MKQLRGRGGRCLKSSGFFQVKPPEMFFRTNFGRVTRERLFRNPLSLIRSILFRKEFRMSGKNCIPLARTFTRMVLAGAAMFPLLSSGRAAGDTHVSVKIAAPHSRVTVVRGSGHGPSLVRIGAGRHDSFCANPAYRYYPSHPVVVTRPVHVYRVAPAKRCWERLPGYRPHSGRHRSDGWSRWNGRGSCGSSDRSRGKGYHRDSRDSRAGKRGKEYSRGRDYSHDSPRGNNRSRERDGAYGPGRRK